MINGSTTGVDLGKVYDIDFADFAALSRLLDREVLAPVIGGITPQSGGTVPAYGGNHYRYGNVEWMNMEISIRPQLMLTLPNAQTQPGNMPAIQCYWLPNACFDNRLDGVAGVVDEKATKIFTAKERDGVYTFKMRWRNLLPKGRRGIIAATNYGGVWPVGESSANGQPFPYSTNSYFTALSAFEAGSFNVLSTSPRCALASHGFPQQMALRMPHFRICTPQGIAGAATNLVLVSGQMHTTAIYRAEGAIKAS